jgi:hypothetical protein
MQYLIIFLIGLIIINLMKLYLLFDIIQRKITKIIKILIKNLKINI